MAHEAGIPEDAVQYVIMSGKDAGELFTKHPVMQKVTFTGSTNVGKKLIAQAGESVENVTMELGGLAPLIVHEDADIEYAVNQTIASKFRNAGQTCICANRVYVHEAVEAEFVKQLTQKVHELKVGNGMDEDVTIGPLINEDGVKKVVNQLKDAESKGAKLSRSLDEAQEMGGNFLKPVVVSNANQDMLAMQEETFGPIVPVATYSDLEDAIQMANDTQFGLVLTSSQMIIVLASICITHLIMVSLVGMMAVHRLTHAPFGGMKESGYGREGGTEGIEPYLETKYLSIGNM